jgi:phosphate transport system permease protein
MSGAAPGLASAGKPSILELHPHAQSRRLRNNLATAAIVVAVLTAVVPLVLIVSYVVRKGAGSLSWSFFTDDIPISDRLPGGGMGPAVVGTLVITGLATLMAVPLGILGGVYLNEYGGNGPLARVVRFLSEVMTGVPSIVMGLFVYTFWVLRFKEQTGFAGALALACLMLPVVIRVTEEMLRLVPRELREGSYALGSRKARTIRTVVFPHAVPGIVSGALLAVARAAGETAPLLFTIGIVTETNTNPFEGPNTALSTQIFRNAGSPFPFAKERAWGAALTLILIVFLFTVLARIVTTLFARRGAA